MTLDTSAVLALVDPEDPWAFAVSEAVERDSGPLLIPAGILAEVTYFLEQRYVPGSLGVFVDDLVTGAYTLHCGEEDLPRVADLVDRYGDLRLGFADATVLACAERAGGRVLTLDRRDFDVVGRELALEALP